MWKTLFQKILLGTASGQLLLLTLLTVLTVLLIACGTPQTQPQIQVVKDSVPTQFTVLTPKPPVNLGTPKDINESLILCHAALVSCNMDKKSILDWSVK